MHQHSRLYTQGFFSFMCITLYFPFSLVRLWISKERGREEGAFFGIINSRIVTGRNWRMYSRALEVFRQRLVFHILSVIHGLWMIYI